MTLLLRLLTMTLATNVHLEAPIEAESQHTESTVNRLAESFMSDGPEHSLSIGVYYQGRAYTFHYGELDPELGNTPDDNTFYEIASISKTFTGRLVAQAVLDGKWSLRDDIRDYLGSEYAHLQYNGQGILIQHLVTHTSGLPANNKPVEELSSNNEDGLLWKRMHEAESNYSKSHFLNDLKAFRLSKEPGTHFNYSNLGTSLTAYMLEQVYDTTFEDLLRLHVYSKAGLTHTRMHLLAFEKDQLASGYNRHGERMLPLPLADTLWGAEGGLKSTVPDMIRYMAYQIDAKDPGVRESLKRLHELDTGYWMATFWWSIDVDRSAEPQTDALSFQHDGGSSGVRNVMLIYPEDHLGIYVVTNKVTPTAFNRMTTLIRTIRHDLIQSN